MMSCLLFILFAVSAEEFARAEAPVTHVDVIDSDGQVSPTHWRTSSTFIWSQNHLLLQAAIEIPSHLASQLPAAYQSHLHGANYRAPFHLTDDHALLVLELSAPILMFKLGNSQSLRVAVDYRETTWMRNNSCRDLNAYLNEVPVSGGGTHDALFIALACKPARGGTWVEVTSSDDSTLSFEPHDQTRFRSVEHGAEFWLPDSASRRTLADILVMEGNGETTSHYTLEVQAPVVSHQTRSPEALPILVSEPTSTSVTESPFVDEPDVKHSHPILGVEAQVIEAHGALDSSRTGKTQTELSLVARVARDLSDDGSLVADLNLPIRRLGAGLDSKGAGSHFAWINAGYLMPVGAGPVTSLSFGAEASVLDIHAPDRETAVSLSPSVEARIGDLYSVVLAPFDLISQLSVLRARADLPLTPDRKNRLTAQALLGRTWIEPQNTSWNINGITLGFVGEF